MALTKFSTDVGNIATLTDRPNQNEGLSSTQLKGRFDKAGTDIKTYINNTLTEELGSVTDGDSGADNIGVTALKIGGSESVQGALEELKSDTSSALTAHTSRTDNPHTVTKAQIGLGNADNTSDATKNSAIATLTNKTLMTPKINEDVALTATATELNVLDGITASTSELNVLDGITASTTELNYVDGVTSAIQTQIDSKAPLASPTLTGNVVLPSTTTIGNVSSTELGYLDGVTSAIQTQIAGKVDKVTGKGLSTNDYDNTEKANVASNTTARHTHTNKATLDTYTQTEANLADAVTKKHSHANKTVLDIISDVTTVLGSSTTKVPSEKAVADAISSAGGGDMLKATYDPTNINASAFDVDNHVSGSTNKVYTATEQSKLGGIEDGAEVNVNADWDAESGDAQILNKPSIPEDASDIAYDNTTSGLTADNAQDAIDELSAEIADLDLSADNVTYDNTTSGLTADEVQGAIDEVVGLLNEDCTVNVSVDDSSSVAGQIITLHNVTQSTTKTYTLASGESSHIFSIVAGTEYYISVDAKSGTQTPSDSDTFTAIINGARTVSMQYIAVKRYGFRRERSNSDPNARITYLYDAVGMTPAYMDFGSGSFNYGSWQTFTEDVARPVMLKSDGTVDYALSRTDFTKKSDGVTASDISNTSYNGNAMIEFGKYKWVYRYADATYDYVIFSNAQYDANYKAYAHTNANGNVKDHFYWGAFKGSNVSSKLRSFADQTIMVSQNRNTEVSYATANGSGHYTIYHSGWVFIGDLLTLISKSDDSQTKFGTGRSKTTNTSAISTGTLKSQPMFKGYNDETSDVKVFGIEGFWGNVWEGMAGLVVNGNIKTKMTPSYNFDGSGYTDTGLDPSGTSGGYISQATVNDASGWIPVVASGSASTYYCDGLWYNTSQVDYALVGGLWNSGSPVGSRCVYLGTLASATYPDVGSRLSFLNPA